MRFPIYLLLAIAGLPTAATAMPASQFIEKWRAVSTGPAANGPRSAEMAAADPQIQVLTAEFAAALQAYRGQLLEARALGKPTRSCPPKEVKLTVDDMIADIERLPVSWQSREFSDAFGKAMNVRYPCASGARTAGPTG